MQFRSITPLRANILHCKLPIFFARNGAKAQRNKSENLTSANHIITNKPVLFLASIGKKIILNWRVILTTQTSSVPHQQLKKSKLPELAFKKNVLLAEGNGQSNGFVSKIAIIVTH